MFFDRILKISWVVFDQLVMNDEAIKILIFYWEGSKYVSTLFHLPRQVQSSQQFQIPNPFKTPFKRNEEQENEQTTTHCYSNPKLFSNFSRFQKTS